MVLPISYTLDRKIQKSFFMVRTLNSGMSREKRKLKNETDNKLISKIWLKYYIDILWE